MSPSPHPQVADSQVLLRRVERLVGEASRCRGSTGPNARLLVLTLREQLAAVIDELAEGCAALASEMAASKLRQTANAAYGAMDLNRRTRT